ncbi:proline-rich protein [Aspergillus uvarum CBS 121591]|uniref:Proline-rich protein n=1 Tax=Aspergillus uvarum CBS 121591 TaxID=1448315 RepID=A0A319CCE9_9EURO|nr:proline-rich protein [Aspergillus uvarum CBS 121591]PYH82844.1 proline-rich protein [Aspergillus uvarum CBS 121591]
MSSFQLFPASPESGTSNNPFLKGKRRQAGGRPVGDAIPLKTLGSKGAVTEGMLFCVDQNTDNVPAPPKAHVARPSQSSSLGTPQEHDARRNASHSESPAPPMRSMFPQYNPQLPLNQQAYYPQASGHTPRNYSRPSNILLSPAPEIDQALGPKTVPASVLNFPSGVLDTPEMRYSSAEELRSLWEAANGQRPQNMPETFNLRLQRSGPTSFSFGEPTAPFYTMQIEPNDGISLTRINPSKSSNSVPIMTFKVEDRSRRELRGDNLVSLLLPRLAAVLALDQVAEMVKEHQLPHQDAIELEADALKRVAEQESCKLFWNSAKHNYELHHPALCKQPPALVGAAGIPLSPVRSKYAGSLQVTVSSASAESRSSQPPIILVTTPVSANAIESANAAATPRTSTLPLLDSDEPLAALDLGTMTLSISGGSTINTVPSLYAIDSVVAAMLAVAVSDEATGPILKELVLYGSERSITPWGQGPGTYGGTGYRGDLVTAAAERDEAQKGSQLWSTVKSALSVSETSEKPTRWYRFWGRRRAPKPRSRKIVVEEFDLERYGRYGQGSSREGQKLPGITRVILRVVFLGLEVVVQLLTWAVKVFAWVLVNATRCVTSERF